MDAAAYRQAHHRRLRSAERLDGPWQGPEARLGAAAPGALPGTPCGCPGADPDRGRREPLRTRAKCDETARSARLENSETLSLERPALGLLEACDIPRVCAANRDQLSRALPLVSNGGFWVPRSVLSGFVDSILSSQGRRLKTGAVTNLSRREQEVLDSLLENLSNKEIASKLNIAERTVKFHVSNLLNKFGVRRRADLILLTFQRRLASQAT